MALHYPTLLLTETFSLLVLGLLSLLLARSGEALRPLRLHGLGLLLMALALPSFLLHGGSLTAWGIALGNGLALAAWGLSLAATRSFAGRRWCVWPAAAACLGWWLACLLPPFMAEYGLRVAIMSLAVGGLSGLIAWEVARLWSDRALPRLLILLMIGSHPMVLAIRLASLFLADENQVRTLTPPMILTGFVAITVGTVVLIAAAQQRAGDAARESLALAHAETQASRDLLARIIDNMPAVVFTGRIHPDGRYEWEYLSHNTERVVGWPFEAMEPTGAFDRRIVSDPADWRSAPRRLFRDGEAFRNGLLERPDGSRIWIRQHARIAQRFPDGSAEMVGTITDITHERTLSARMQASAKLATLGEMAANLAHELGQPAATMCLAAGNAARGLREQGEAAIPDALRRLDRIIAQGERMSALMQHLRAFARAEPIALGPVAVGQVVKGALELTEAGLRQEAIALEVDVPPDLPPVRGQLVPLEQVLVNLLLNARDAVRRQPAGAPRRIRLAAAAEGADAVRITVADTGGGIEPAVLPRLFEPFVTTKPMGEGLGLGLSVSHGLVRAMGGGIAAENRGDGAAFTVTLACAAASVPA